jgi:uncharacterized Tic20 family protein
VADLAPLKTPARPSTGADAARDSGGAAVVSFISGLVGLLFANIVLGPVAIVLAVSALRRGTDRRGRAVLGLLLGVADLVVFAVLVVHSSVGHGGPVWHFAGV